MAWSHKSKIDHFEATSPGQGLTSGGSSGGAGSAVASYVCPVAVSEAKPTTTKKTTGEAFNEKSGGWKPTIFDA